jgi:hypothetical protein
LIVWQLLVPGAHTVTVTFGILTKFCAPEPTVMGTVFDAVAATGCALGVLPELPLTRELLTELLSEPLPPPPQAASKIDRLIAASQRGRPERTDERWDERDEETVGRIVKVSIRYLISLALTPAGNAGGR